VPRKAGRFKKLKPNQYKRICKRLDRAIRSESALRLPRDLAVKTLLTYCEVVKGKNLKDRREGKDHLQNYSDALQFAQYYCHKYCALSHGASITSEDISRAWVQCGRLFETMNQYVLLWDFLLMGISGQADVKFVRQKKLEFRYSQKVQKENAAASRYWGSPETPFDLVLAPESKYTGQELFDACDCSTEGGVLSYKITDEVFEDKMRVADLALQRYWSFEKDWDLGGYTVEEFRCVWKCLLSLSSIHRHLASHAGNVNPKYSEAFIDQFTRTQRYDVWAVEISEKLPSISRKNVELIIDDLIFDVSLLNRPDETIAQPFFRYSNGDLGLSYYQLLVSHPEETIFRVIQLKRKTLHSKLVNMREKTQTLRVANLVSGIVEHFDDFKVRHDGKNSNLDLLLVDRTAKFALSCELKWTMGPRWYRNLDTVRGTLGKGVSQSELCVDWVKTGPQSIAQRTGISSSDLRTFRVEGIVISQRSLSGVQLPKPQIPVVNELIIEVLQAKLPSKNLLCALWTTCKIGGYLPKEGVHYSLVDRQAKSVLGYSFMGRKTDAIHKLSFTRDDLEVFPCI